MLWVCYISRWRLRAGLYMQCFSAPLLSDWFPDYKAELKSFWIGGLFQPCRGALLWVKHSQVNTQPCSHLFTYIFHYSILSSLHQTSLNPQHNSRRIKKRHLYSNSPSFRGEVSHVSPGTLVKRTHTRLRTQSQERLLIWTTALICAKLLKLSTLKMASWKDERALVICSLLFVSAFYFHFLYLLSDLKRESR